MYHISFQEDSLKPRERLVQHGAHKLSNQELLSILLRTGNRKETVFEISQKIIASMSSLGDFQDMTLQELQTLSGIGQIKAIELQAAIEFGKRIAQVSSKKREPITSSRSLARKMIQELGHKKQEHLVALYLNSQNHMIHQQTIFIGSVSRSIAEPREIMHYAVKHMAASLILVHNHPSGVPKPSENDHRVTQTIRKACELMGLVFLDHLIVGGDHYFSYREETDFL